MSGCLLGLVALAAVGARADPPPRLVSPEVLPDHRVTFRLRAPWAQEVSLALSGAPSATMLRDGEGVWSVTTEPLEPDVYSYSFAVDGVSLMDPSNHDVIRNWVWPGSLVHVPGPLTLPWEINDVPRGRVHEQFYTSAVIGDDRSFFVYTPPGYDPRAAKTYPVLYLLHGYSDDAGAWTQIGRAHVIMDNLIARHQAVPMLVVMPLGYGDLGVLAPATGPRDPALSRRNVERFGEGLLKEVQPAVERAYRVTRGREARAIAGLSMGGGEALAVGLNALDRFAWIGAFSSGGAAVDGDFEQGFPALSSKDNARLRLLWVSCGKDDWLVPKTRVFAEWLKGKGITHTFREPPGAHNWMVWRRNLAEFAPLLFR